MRKNRQAFTIIELLIVVIVIGVLAAAGLAKYQNFAENARRRTCISNQTSVENANAVWETNNFSFRDDCNGWWRYWPRYGNVMWQQGCQPTNFTNNNGRNIAEIIRDDKAFHCPTYLRTWYNNEVQNLPNGWGNGWGSIAYCAVYRGPSGGSPWGSGEVADIQPYSYTYCTNWGRRTVPGPDGGNSTRHSARW